MFVNGSTEERVDVEDWARFRQVDRLADIDRHRDHVHPFLFLEPRDGDGGVEPPGVRQHYLRGCHPGRLQPVQTAPRDLYRAACLRHNWAQLSKT